MGVDFTDVVLIDMIVYFGMGASSFEMGCLVL
jgi:hypothetical protein